MIFATLCIVTRCSSCIVCCCVLCVVFLLLLINMTLYISGKAEANLGTTVRLTLARCELYPLRLDPRQPLPAVAGHAKWGGRGWGWGCNRWILLLPHSYRRGSIDFVKRRSFHLILGTLKLMCWILNAPDVSPYVRTRKCKARPPPGPAVWPLFLN